jgi:tryptophanyl-tRNA synthetase
LIYRAGLVPEGEDQVAHVEMTREIARRFNHLYGRKPGYEDRAKEAVKKLGKKTGALYREVRPGDLEKGDHTALEEARALLEKQKNISIGDKERLYGYLEGGGKIILPEPQALLTPSPKVPGLDGQKMSKSYNNIIALRDEPDEIEQKMRTMPTDPARVRRSDPGDPAKCPVWPFHEVYSDDDTRRWVQEGCRTAGIGCIECKKKVIDAVIAELEPIRKRAADYSNDPTLVKNIIAEGCERAQDVAEETLTDVRQAMGLGYN